MSYDWRASLTALAALVGPTQAGAQAPSTVQEIVVDGRVRGTRFEGIGVVDGGGATSVLLKDYPEPQRSQILDLVYRPKFGASVSTLLVEVPGDGNSTQGSMPSHMHVRDEVNYRRGYTWWILAEARRRNPRLALDAAAWSAPGWIGDDGRLFADGRNGDPAFFSQDSIDYYVSWLKGLRGTYGLELDAIGVRNEKGVSYDFAKAMRKSLDSNGFTKVRLHAFDNWPDWKFDFVKDMAVDQDLRSSLDVVGGHVSPVDGGRVPSAVRDLARQMDKPLWNTEQHVYRAGYDGLISTVRSFNEGFISNGFSKIVDWYGIAGLYTTEPYSGEKEATVRANWPWSGTYQVNPKLWAYAHYGQFTEIGWQYLGKSSGYLDAGGSYVALKSPDANFSVILETRDATRSQNARFRLRGVSTGSVAVWKSTEAAQFVRQPDLKARDGTIEIVLDPRAVYSLTTTRGQRKGGFQDIPGSKAFPFPYRERFDGYDVPARWGYLPRFFADIYGAFELSSCPGRTGGCLRQVAPVRPISWAPDWFPYTIIGDDRWQDYDIAAEVYLKEGDRAGVMGRVNHVGTGYGFVPKGYYLSLSSSGEVDLTVVRGKPDKKALVGDAEQQAIIKASRDNQEGGEKVLASSKVTSIAPNAWHALRLRFEGPRITGFVDGRAVVTADDALYRRGMAGLLAGRSGMKMSTPYYDDVTITAVGANPPAADSPRSGQRAMYGAAR